MSKTVYNYPRHHVENNIEIFNTDENVWISIQEPGNEHSTNIHLDRLPVLKLKFWDIDAPGWFLNKDGSQTEYVNPVDDETLDTLYQFLIEHQNKNVITNCRMGISRSGAISQFCSEYLGHQWHTESEDRAMPNDYVYQNLVKRWRRDNNSSLFSSEGKYKVIDKRKNQS